MKPYKFRKITAVMLVAIMMFTSVAQPVFANDTLDVLTEVNGEEIIKSAVTVEAEIDGVGVSIGPDGVTVETEIDGVGVSIGPDGVTVSIGEVTFSPGDAFGEYDPNEEYSSLTKIINVNGKTYAFDLTKMMTSDYIDGDASDMAKLIVEPYANGIPESIRDSYQSNFESTAEMIYTGYYAYYKLAYSTMERMLFGWAGIDAKAVDSSYKDQLSDNIVQALALSTSKKVFAATVGRVFSFVDELDSIDGYVMPEAGKYSAYQWGFIMLHNAEVQLNGLYDRLDIMMVDARMAGLYGDGSIERFILAYDEFNKSKHLLPEDKRALWESQLQDYYLKSIAKITPEVLMKAMDDLNSDVTLTPQRIRFIAEVLPFFNAIIDKPEGVSFFEEKYVIHLKRTKYAQLDKKMMELILFSERYATNGIFYYDAKAYFKQLPIDMERLSEYESRLNTIRVGQLISSALPHVSRAEQVAASYISRGYRVPLDSYKYAVGKVLQIDIITPESDAIKQRVRMLGALITAHNNECDRKALYKTAESLIVKAETYYKDSDAIAKASVAISDILELNENSREASNQLIARMVNVLSKYKSYMSSLSSDVAYQKVERLVTKAISYNTKVNKQAAKDGIYALSDSYQKEQLILKMNTKYPGYIE